jgi:general nucleoside transport system permease protein
MMSSLFSFKTGNISVERIDNVTGFRSVVFSFFSLILSLIVSALLIKMADADILTAFSSLWSGAFGSMRALLETLVRSTPLILTGLAAALAFRGKIWNIGADGQLFIGAMAGFWATQMFGGFPSILLIPIIIIFSFMGGALWGVLAGYLKTRFEVDVIISTIMLNYIATYFLSFMLSANGPWREEGSFYQQTAKLAKNTFFPIFVPRSRLHLGFLIAIVVAVLVYILIKKTSLGFEIRAFGFNPKASRFKGMNVSKTVIIIMFISGGIAGLAGAGELFGIHHRLRPDISIGLGYTGIIVAMLAALNPLAVIPAAIIFGALLNGAAKLQIISGVPSSLIYAIQAIVLLFYLTGTTLSRYRIRRIRNVS